jgi:hypothetical protein
MGIHGSGPAPKYSQYQVPGGTAYKETLITQPEKAPQALPKGYSIQPLTSNPNAKFALQSPDGSGWVLHAMTEEQAHAGALNRLQNEGIISKPENFRSSHFDQPNILVHVRSNERTLPSGEHGLFLEEVQSDWHQKGKAEGYQQPVPPESKMTWNEYAKSKGISPAEASQAFGDRSDPRFNDWMAHYEKGNEIGLANQKAVPDAPFKEQWPDLALKHQLLDAAKRPDLQWLGFTSGETQAARYDLSQTVDKIAWEPKIPAAGEGTMVSIYMPKNGSIPVKVPVGVDGKIGQTYQASAHQFEGKHLADVVGKDVADHIMGKASGELAGEGLNIGGKGMRFFYDNLLPKRLEKIVKPFGGTVERAPVSTLDPRTLPYGPFTGGTAPAWIVKLTPEMKQRILKEGLPLMTGVAAVAASQQEQK